MVCIFDCLECFGCPVVVGEGVEGDWLCGVLFEGGFGVDYFFGCVFDCDLNVGV